MDRFAAVFRAVALVAFVTLCIVTQASFAAVPSAVPSIGGTVGYNATCGGKGMLYASTPDLAIQGCIVSVYPFLSANAGMTFSFNSCATLQNGYCTYNYVRSTGTTGTAQESVTIATLPAKANCSSGVFDAVYGTCIGGPATCPAMDDQFLTVFDCPGSSIEDGLCTGNSGLVPGTIPQLLSYSSCQYVLADPLMGGNCWESSANKAMYCSFQYVSDGTLAPTSETRALTDAATSVANACPAGGCPSTGGGGGSSGTGSDGTTGGTGTVACGGSGQPACANGVPSGTTACGASGQPACASTGGGGSGGSAPVCGGPGLPACSVVDVGAAPVCGGPGLPACASVDAAGNALLSSIAASLTGEGAASADPVPASVDDLKIAGLDGGSTFSGLTSWTLPAHTSTCPSGSFNAFGKVFVIDAQCRLALDNLAPLRAAMIVSFTLAALFIVLRA